MNINSLAATAHAMVADLEASFLGGFNHSMKWQIHPQTLAEITVAAESDLHLNYCYSYPDSEGPRLIGIQVEKVSAVKPGCLRLVVVSENHL